MSIDQNNINDVIGRDVHGSDGEKIGQVGQVYLDDETGKPEWVTVMTGMFGTKESFVPVAQAQFSDDGLRVPYDKGTVKDAPRVDADQGHLSQDEEAELYRHYGLDYSGDRSDSGLPDRNDGGRGTDVDETVGHDTSGPTTDDAMTRSEEQLKVGTEKRETGRARLRKHVVTEEQTVTVPVTREEVTIEREPITDANRDEAMAGPDISEEEHEVVLTEERPVVEKETVAVERVKLGKETVTDQEQVSESVRKEQIDTDGVEGDTPGQSDRGDQGRR
ncbi:MULTISPECIES: DUF2382 domain-containing protein [unclassified Knoellia]|uniref:DUF2382 domain-containing protein n=1 Tax=Knoellia altitudinis TaxID=3404795 RepID=UPI00361A91B9